MTEKPLHTSSTQALATWKFDLLATVDADPLLSSNTACLSVVRVHLHYANRRGNYVTSYASNATIRALTGKSERTIQTARQLLVELGYLTIVGSTKCNCTRYRIDNPRGEIVKMLVEERKWKIKEELKDKKQKDRLREERKKRASIVTADHVQEKRVSDWEDSGQEPGCELATAFGCDDQDDPFNPPKCEAETEELIDSIFFGLDLHPKVRERLVQQLQGGVLTPRMAQGMREGHRTYAVAPKHDADARNAASSLPLVSPHCDGQSDQACV